MKKLSEIKTKRKKGGLLKLKHIPGMLKGWVGVSCEELYSARWERRWTRAW